MKVKPSENFDDVVREFCSCQCVGNHHPDRKENEHGVRLLAKATTHGKSTANPHVCISAITESKWRRIEVAIDSGPCENVLNPDDLPDHVVRETAASASGEQFASATGDPIPNLGEMGVMLVTREQTMRPTAFTAAPVASP